MFKKMGVPGGGCARAAASYAGATLQADWPRLKTMLLGRIRKTDRIKTRIRAASERCERPTIRRALSRGEKAFHSLLSGAGREVRFGAERDLTRLLFGGNVVELRRINCVLS